jgi:transcriptional regulator with XRE-family HTH domain
MRSAHIIVPMTQGASPEDAARRRLRSLRTSRGWSLDDLSARTHISASTLSRLESGRRRLAIDHLVALARALGTTVEELVAADEGGEVVIRPTRDQNGDAMFWRLTHSRDSPDRTVVKMRIPAHAEMPEPRVHRGRDWFYVLTGVVHLRLGDRDVFISAGHAASFDTMTPHAMRGHEGPTEILSILDHHGERAHLHDG